MGYMLLVDEALNVEPLTHMAFAGQCDRPGFARSVPLLLDLRGGRGGAGLGGIGELPRWER